MTSEHVVRSYFAAINDTRLDDLAGGFAEDASLHFPLTDPIVGRENIRRFYEGVLEFYPTRYDDARRFFFSADGSVAVEIYFEGRTATGRDVAFDAVDLFTIAEGRIQKLQIFYDSAKVMEMIGGLPNQ